MASTATLERPKTGTVTRVKPLSWLDHMIERGRQEPFAEPITITPELAAEMLERNPDNRAIKNLKVRHFAADMRAGRWAFNGEPIIVADTGELNDGQHRLSALIEANAALSFVVVFGVPRSTRTTVDQGSARSAGDYLLMEGRPYAKNAATVAKYVLAYERSDGRNLQARTQITNAEVVDRVRDDPKITDAAAYGLRHVKAYRHLTSHSVIATAFYLLSKVDAADAVRFLDQVCLGENIERGDPAFAVRNALLWTKRYREDALEVVLIGWNAFRSGQQMQRVRTRGVFPVLI